jgi:7-cyano-7-deazaguanine reductase
MVDTRAEELKDIALGKKITEFLFDKPDANILETFQNKNSERDYIVDIKIPEFTCLCPITGQPDFATIYLRYIPNEKCIESKSLKLYIFSYRNFGEFHEDVVNRILNDCVDVCEPRWMQVVGEFRVRGGISIMPIAEYKKKGFKVPAYARMVMSIHEKKQKIE